MDKIEEGLLNEISDLDKLKQGAYNIRKNGQGVERNGMEQDTRAFSGTYGAVAPHDDQPRVPDTGARRNPEAEARFCFLRL